MDLNQSISPEYPIDRLTAVLDNAQVGALYHSRGFMSYIDIPDSMLTQEDKDILCQFMRAEENPDLGLVIFLRGNDQQKIIFESQNDAILSSSQQIPNLSKQLMFSIYRKTGVKFSIGTQIFNPGA